MQLTSKLFFIAVLLGFSLSSALVADGESLGRTEVTVASLVGEWEHLLPTRAVIREIYSLIPQGDNRFIMRWTRAFAEASDGYQWRDVHPTSPWGRNYFQGVLSGNKITGTYEEYDYKCGGGNETLMHYPITGEVLETGG